MTAADRAYLDGFAAALAIAHAAADRIAASDMHVLRKEMAAEALRSFAEEAIAVLDIGNLLKSPPDLHLRNFSATSISFAKPGLHEIVQTPRGVFPEFGENPASDFRTRAVSLGYVGEACPDCANFTLVRNGTCLKCDTCGSTTGCS